MVMDEDVCASLKQLARKEGLLHSSPAGAAAAAAHKVAGFFGSGKLESLQFFRMELRDV